MDHRIFYLCSYGGCGSKVIAAYLRHFGKVYHVRSRYPPSHLTHIGNSNTLKPIHSEWFSCSPVPNKDLDKYTVIYLYRNPIPCIYKRFNTSKHLYTIQCKYPQVTVDQVISNKKDLFGIQEFYLNYTRAQTTNYSIYCVRYEDFLENIETFNATIHLPNIPSIYPTIETTTNSNETLEYVYRGLIQEMLSKPFIYKN
jgi:hypothetical protein